MRLHPSTKGALAAPLAITVAAAEQVLLIIELHMGKANSRGSRCSLASSAMSPSELQLHASAKVRPNILWQMNLSLTLIARALIARSPKS